MPSHSPSSGDGCCTLGDTEGDATVTDGRESDPPLYRDLQRHLDRVDEHLTKLRDDFNAERVANANKFSDLKEAIHERSQFPWSAKIGITAILVTVLGGGFKIYSDLNEGLTTARVELRESTNVAHKALQMIDSHIATAGPFREGVARWQKDMEQCEARLAVMDKQVAVNTMRLEHIEARNKIADANWDRVRAKGLLVEATGEKQ